MSKPELKAKPKAKSKMEFWTPTEKENTKAEYGCEILLTNVTYKEAMSNYSDISKLYSFLNKFL